MKNIFTNAQKSNKGITLIALVVTIIVLLILAGISIAMLVGDNGILQRGTDAKQNSERAEAKEQAQMDIFAWITDKTANYQDTSLDDSKVKDILTGKSYVKTANDTSFITSKGEYEIPYSELYTSYKFVTETLASEALKVNPEGVTDAEKSSYVLYKDAFGKDLLCRVLYNNNGIVELVTVDAIAIVLLGYNDSTIPESATGYNFTGTKANFEKARWSFNNAIFTLNSKAETYMNTEISDRARCIGSNPTNPENESGRFTFRTEYTTKPYLLDGDTNYITDYHQLQAISANSLRESGPYDSEMVSCNFYWLASRRASGSSQSSAFDVYAITSAGSFSSRRFMSSWQKWYSKWIFSF